MWPNSIILVNFNQHPVLSTPQGVFVLHTLLHLSLLQKGMRSYGQTDTNNG